MSYILEALKKSEMERRAGTLVGLAPAATYVVAPEAPSRPRGVAVLGGLAMLAVGLGIGAWRPWQAEAPIEPVQRTVVPAVAPAPVEAPVAAPPVETVGAAALPPEEKPAVEASPPPAAEVPHPIRLVAPAKLKVASRINPQPREVPSAPAKPADIARAASVPESGKMVVPYADLPGDIRSAVPPIAFGGYAGTDEGGRRIAFINDRLVKEGEEVSPGVRLEEVAAQGAVLDYRGYRFRP
ncbi:MAG: general secretion pathway protein GspB [Actinomycetota bacterium]